MGFVNVHIFIIYLIEFEVTGQLIGLVLLGVTTPKASDELVAKIVQNLLLKVAIK